LINDILDFSKIEAGKLVIEKIEFDLDEILENRCQTVMAKARDKALNIVYQVDTQVPYTLKGEPFRLSLQQRRSLCAANFSGRDHTHLCQHF
jgi:two-component system sensor histidine kinase/response regulator